MKIKTHLKAAPAVFAGLLSAMSRKIAIAGLLAASVVAASATNYTTGTTNVINPNGKTVLEATGNSFDATTFSNNVATAFANETGGVWNFDGSSFSVNVGETITLNYGASLTNSLVLTLSSGNTINQGNTGGEPTSGSLLMGLSGDGSTRVYTPNKPLLAVAIFNTDRNDSGRTVVLTATYLDATTASTSGANADNVYFHGLSGAGTNPIVSFSISQNNFVRYDDLGFIVSTQSLSPTITTQPASQNIYQNEDLALSAVAVGSSLAYQWQAGAPGSGIYTNVPGATSANLTVPWIQESADYIIVITNTSGSVTSDVASVTVNLPDYANGLFNGSFELPGTGKINAGFDVAGANNVPGWRNAGPNQNDEGIESAGSGYTGSYAAYLHRGQSGAYQITTNVLHQGDSITLTWYERDNYQGVNRKVSLLNASSQTNAFDGTTILTAVTNEVTGWWTQKILNYTAGAGDAGKFLGVALQSADPATATGWANFDDFSILITPPDAAPVIVTPPANQTAWLASTTTLTVVASGANLNYQWQAGTVGSGIYTNISNGGQFSGANTATLTIANVMADNGLDYVVAVSNTGGSVTSSPPATMTVDLDAPYMGSVASKTVNQYDNTTLSPSYVTGATSYQWMAGTVGSGIYTNLVNGGRFSGVNTATLSISNLQPADGLDYVLVASNVSGSTTNSVPATLTVITIIYLETFNSDAPTLAGIGWVADAINGMYQNIDSSNNLVMYNTGAGAQAFYTTTKLDTGATGLAFPVINLTNVTGLTFSVDNQSWWNPDKLHTYLAVQMNGGQWYVSTSEIPQASSGWTTQTQTLDTNSYAWNDLTVSGTGGTNSASVPLIGSASANGLTGYITGAGLVLAATTDSAYVHYDNFKITGDGFTILPGLSMTSSGSTVTLTWGYGTLIESDSVTGPWTPVSGATSPKTVSSSTGTHFYALQLP
jgi:hypothetical protein